MSPETPGFEETWYAQGCSGKKAVKERGRQQSLSAAEPQRRRAERPLAPALTRQGLDSPCRSLPLPGRNLGGKCPTTPPSSGLAHAICGLLFQSSITLPAQLMRVCFICFFGVFSSRARSPPVGTRFVPAKLRQGASLGGKCTVARSRHHKSGPCSKGRGQIRDQQLRELRQESPNHV